MGKFVTRGNIDKMTRDQAEAAANQELQQKIGGRGQPSTADEPVESHFTMPAWARDAGGEGLLARIARQRREATTLTPNDDAEPEATPVRRSPRARAARTERETGPRAARTERETAPRATRTAPRSSSAARATPAKRAAAPRKAAPSKTTKAVKAVKTTRVTKATKAAKATGVSKATKATRATRPAAKRRPT